MQRVWKFLTEKIATGPGDVGAALARPAESARARLQMEMDCILCIWACVVGDWWCRAETVERSLVLWLKDGLMLVVGDASNSDDLTWRYICLGEYELQQRTHLPTLLRMCRRYSQPRNILQCSIEH